MAEIQVEQKTLKTDAEIADTIEYYRQVQDEIARLETSKEIVKNVLLDAFKERKLREFTTQGEKILLAQVITRIFKRISFTEAKALLDEDVLKKLTRETTLVILSVRELKK